MYAASQVTDRSRRGREGTRAYWRALVGELHGSRSAREARTRTQSRTREYAVDQSRTKISVAFARGAPAQAKAYSAPKHVLDIEGAFLGQR
jgi:hypothetical protein